MRQFFQTPFNDRDALEKLIDFQLADQNSQDSTGVIDLLRGRGIFGGGVPIPQIEPTAQRAPPQAEDPSFLQSGGFLDRFLGNAQRGIITGGFREGFFGAQRAKQQAQLQQLESDLVRSKIVDNFAAADVRQQNADSAALNAFTARDREGRTSSEVRNPFNAIITDADGSRRNVRAGSIAGQFVVTDPVTGEFRVPTPSEADQIEAQAQRIVNIDPTDVAGTGTEDTKALPSIPPGTDVSPATGSSGVLGNAVNKIAEVFGLGQPFPSIGEGRVALEQFNAAAITALADAQIEGRPSNFLLENFQPLLVQPGEFLTGDTTAKQKIDSQVDFLRSEIGRIDRDILSNPQAFTDAAVSKTRATRSLLEQMLVNAEVLQSNFGARDTRGDISRFNR